MRSVNNAETVQITLKKYELRTGKSKHLTPFGKKEKD